MARIDFAYLQWLTSNGLQASDENRSKYLAATKGEGSGGVRGRKAGWKAEDHPVKALFYRNGEFVSSADAVPTIPGRTAALVSAMTLHKDLDTVVFTGSKITSLNPETGESIEGYVPASAMDLRTGKDIPLSVMFGGSEESAEESAAAE